MVNGNIFLEDSKKQSKRKYFYVFHFDCNSVTKNYFENLVRALENGLADVDSHAACSKTTNSKYGGGGGASKGKSGRGKGSGKIGGSHDAGR